MLAVTPNKHVHPASSRTAPSSPKATASQHSVSDGKNKDNQFSDLGIDDGTIKNMVEYFKLDDGSIDDLIKYIRELARHNHNNL